MRRRDFLCDMLRLCSALWLGTSVFDISRAKAKQMVAKIISIRTGLEKQTNLQQAYFWFEALISAHCEVIKKQTANEVTFLLKDCQPGESAEKTEYTNPYIRQAEVRAIEQRDCLIRLVSRNKDGLPELKYSLIPSVLYAGRFCLRIEIGTFAPETAISEKDLEIRENNFDFGPMETRAATDFVVIHHTELTAAESTAEAVHRLHLKRGWSGIGYHYVIDQNGLIERGRPRDTVGAHTYQNNDTSIGIALAGNFNKEEPSAVQLEKAALLLAALSHLYGFAPDENHVFGHRNFNSVSCPGENLYWQLPQLRSKAMAYWRR